MAVSLNAVCDFLNSFAPVHLAEDWDNVGLLVGDDQQVVQRIMTCLTVTPASVEEAIDQQADLIVSHHPLPFRPLKRLTTQAIPSRLLLQLIRAGVGVYSPHTAFDSAREGINQLLAEGVGLTEIMPLVPNPQDEDGLGAGRCGRCAPVATVAEMITRLKLFLGLDGLHVVGRLDQPVGRAAVACGAAGEFLRAAQREDCQMLVLGETNFHTCLEAEASDVALLLPGHFASERFAVEVLAERLAANFPEVTVWPSRRERDPLQWV